MIFRVKNDIEEQEEILSFYLDIRYNGGIGVHAETKSGVNNILLTITKDGRVMRHVLSDDFQKIFRVNEMLKID